MIDGVVIDGVTRSGGGDSVELLEPWSGQSLCEVGQGSIDDLDEAVACARATFASGDWAEMSPLGRARVMHKIAALMRENVTELSEIETSNVGRPLPEGVMNVGLAADAFDFFASLTTHLRGSTVPMGPGLFDYTLREPLGVVGLITPWNNPIVLTSWKVAAALAAGNSVVVKPASQTPLSILRIVTLLHQAGIPSGQVNVVNGPGSTVGDRLVKHPDVNKISFTGSTEIGKRVLASAAANLTRVSLELGGKSPSLVFADADLDSVLAGSIPAMFANAGQMCTARSRILVESSIAQELTERLAEKVSALRLGNPFEPATQLGPVISRNQRDVVWGFINRAVKEGAQIATGGWQPPDQSELESGWFIQPTILTGVDDDMEVVREEVFGPVLVIDTFDEEAEAVQRSNASRYGLAATVWTRDLERAHRVAHALESGTVTVNTTKVSHVYAPFGGWKESGLGRELGTEGLDEFLQYKNVVISVPSARA